MSNDGSFCMQLCSVHPSLGTSIHNHVDVRVQLLGSFLLQNCGRRRDTCERVSKVLLKDGEGLRKIAKDKVSR